MLSFISWQQYLLVITTAGFLYYLAVLLAYYRRRVTSVFVSQRQTKRRPATAILGEAKADAQDPISISDLEFNSGEENQEQQNPN